MKNVEENGKEMGEFYLEINVQAQNYISDSADAGQCVVVGNRKWKIICNIRDMDP